MCFRPRDDHGAKNRSSTKPAQAEPAHPSIPAWQKKTIIGPEAEADLKCILQERA